MPIELIVAIAFAVLALSALVIAFRRHRHELPAPRDAHELPPAERAPEQATPRATEEDAPSAPSLDAGDATTATDERARIDPRARHVGEADHGLPPVPTVEVTPRPTITRFAPPPTSPGAEAPAATPAAIVPIEVPTPVVSLPVEKPRRVEVDERTRALLRTGDEQDEGERYRKGLAKTRGGFVAKLARLLGGKRKVDANLKDEIEEVLFTADIGASAAQRLLDRVTEVLDKREIADADAVWNVIREGALATLSIPATPLDFKPNPPPYVLLMIGVNGVGKTTTLGKLAAQHAAAGRKVLLVAGDTFRAAAVEQLEVWTRRVGCELHRGADKADPSAVIFEGIARGRREHFDVVLCDTAGRLHTRKELMDELGKVRRACAKALGQGLDPERARAITGPHDTFLVLDATIGQNALAQAKLFKETMEFTGLVITKLDGTAKGGVVLGIVDELGIPIRYIGVGEGIDDLRDFDAATFCEALFTAKDRDEATTQTRDAATPA